MPNALATRSDSRSVFCDITNREMQSPTDLRVTPQIGLVCDWSSSPVDSARTNCREAMSEIRKARPNRSTFNMVGRSRRSWGSSCVGGWTGSIMARGQTCRPRMRLVPKNMILRLYCRTGHASDHSVAPVVRMIQNSPSCASHRKRAPVMKLLNDSVSRMSASVPVNPEGSGTPATEWVCRLSSGSRSRQANKKAGSPVRRWSKFRKLSVA